MDEKATHVTSVLLEMLLVPCAKKKEDITKLFVAVEERNPYMTYLMTLESMTDHFAECNFHTESKEDSWTLDQEYEEMWTATLNVNEHPTTIKLDTGAAVSVISSNEP